ncbi:hypothetical protein [Winogradskyella sp. R77965]|uniref:hypothetical protein n=1 Tax=Winogradskyella sp. R77965 TaxID=3093872 RepID=UPI0037DD449F
MKNTIFDITTEKAGAKFYLVLGFSLLFFLRKGIQYAFIGSYVPIIIILIVISLLVCSKVKSLKFHKKAIKLWSVLLIIWSIFRILMTIIILFLKSINESHIYEQLGVFGFLLSLIIMFIGVYLYRKSKYLYKKTSSNQ